MLGLIRYAMVMMVCLLSISASHAMTLDNIHLGLSRLVSSSLGGFGFTHSTSSTNIALPSVSSPLSHHRVHQLNNRDNKAPFSAELTSFGMPLVVEDGASTLLTDASNASSSLKQALHSTSSPSLLKVADTKLNGETVLDGVVTAASSTPASSTTNVAQANSAGSGETVNNAVKFETAKSAPYSLDKVDSEINQQTISAPESAISEAAQDKAQEHAAVNAVAAKEEAKTNNAVNQGDANATASQVASSSESAAPSSESAATTSESAAPAAPAEEMDISSNLFVLISAILVIAMSVPGVALFYAGLVRAKNALSVLEQCLVIFCVSMVIWMVVGYSLAFSSWGNGEHSGIVGCISLLIGDFNKSLLIAVNPSSVFSGISEYTYIIFQGAFCAISGCLIVGALAERVRFSALIIGISIWTLFSYVPLAHMVWGGGFIEHYFAAYDFAGGTVVHINAAVAAIVAAKILGPRHQLNKIAMHPHSLPLAYLGCGLLWVGWFGFNAGSNIIPDGNSALAFANTVFAPVAGAITWTMIEMRIHGKPSTLGSASGVLAGLVGITPACAFVSPIGALVIGAASSAVCVWGVRGFKRLTKIDDSLDVFGIHGLGAIVGALLTGIFCDPSLGGVGYKGYHEGMISQFLGQLWSVLFAIVWSGIVSIIAFKIAEKCCKSLRVSHDDETVGLDLTTHGERSYIL